MKYNFLLNSVAVHFKVINAFTLIRRFKRQLFLSRKRHMTFTNVSSKGFGKIFDKNRKQHREHSNYLATQPRQPIHSLSPLPPPFPPSFSNTTLTLSLTPGAVRHTHVSAFIADMFMHIIRRHLIYLFVNSVVIVS